MGLGKLLWWPPRTSAKLSAVLALGAAVVYNEWSGGIIIYSMSRHDARMLVPSSREDGDVTRSPTVSRHILLVRHGQYYHQSVNDEDRFLTPLGQTQAELTGQSLKDMAFHYTILLSSPMTRAWETADIIHKYLPQIVHVVDNSLAEIDVPPVDSWRQEPKQYFEDGEMIEKAFRKYFKKADKGQTVDSFEIIVCHANVIRYFINRCTGACFICTRPYKDLPVTEPVPTKSCECSTSRKTRTTYK